MRIAGITRNSLVDYPGKIAAVIFTQGCNMDCIFCHNKCLIAGSETDLICEEEVLAFLDKRKSLLDGVVITGGEPTLQPDLESFIIKVKALGYAVKLDTNGTNPDMLENLIKKELLDYVAMDVKAPIERYDEICRVIVDRQKLIKSISLLKEDRTPYEFRTTFCPQLNDEDLQGIGKLVSGAKKYVIQQYRETDEVLGGYTGGGNRRNIGNEPYDGLRSYVSNVQARGDIHFIAL